MRRAGRWMMSALALIAHAGAALSQSKTDAPDIVVQGKTDEALDAFFKAAAPTRNGDQIARWDERLCPKVMNIDPPVASFINDTFRRIAVDHKIPISGSQNCEPNIEIIFTDDSDALTKAIFTRYSRQYIDAEQNFLSKDDIREAKTPRAIRWLAIDGYPMASLNRNLPSRIRSQTHRIIGSSLIIVDIKRLDGIQWGQIGAYIAMIALTDPKLGGNFSGQDSILSLFDGDPARAPKDLTTQDQALIDALYTSDSYQSAAAQRSDMRRIQKRGAAKAAAR